MPFVPFLLNCSLVFWYIHIYIYRERETDRDRDRDRERQREGASFHRLFT